MHPHSSLNAQRRIEALASGRHSMDLADELHPLGHPTEDGKALAVGVALSTEIEFWLVANADEERMGGTVGS